MLFAVICWTLLKRLFVGPDGCPILAAVTLPVTFILPGTTTVSLDLPNMIWLLASIIAPVPMAVEKLYVLAEESTSAL